MEPWDNKTGGHSEMETSTTRKKTTTATVTFEGTPSQGFAISYAVEEESVHPVAKTVYNTAQTKEPAPATTKMRTPTPAKTATPTTAQSLTSTPEQTQKRTQAPIRTKNEAHQLPRPMQAKKRPQPNQDKELGGIKSTPSVTITTTTQSPTSTPTKIQKTTQKPIQTKENEAHPTAPPQQSNKRPGLNQEGLNGNKLTQTPSQSLISTLAESQKTAQSVIRAPASAQTTTRSPTSTPTKTQKTTQGSIRTKNEAHQLPRPMQAKKRPQPNQDKELGGIKSTPSVTITTTTQSPTSTPTKIQKTTQKPIQTKENEAHPTAPPQQSNKRPGLNQEGLNGNKLTQTPSQSLISTLAESQKTAQSVIRAPASAQTTTRSPTSTPTKTQKTTQGSIRTKNEAHQLPRPMQAKKRPQPNQDKELGGIKSTPSVTITTTTQSPTSTPTKIQKTTQKPIQTKENEAHPTAPPQQSNKRPGLNQEGLNGNKLTQTPSQSLISTLAESQKTAQSVIRAPASAQTTTRSPTSTPTKTQKTTQGSIRTKNEAHAMAPPKQAKKRPALNKDTGQNDHKSRKTSLIPENVCSQPADNTGICSAQGHTRGSSAMLKLSLNSEKDKTQHLSTEEVQRNIEHTKQTKIEKLQDNIEVKDEEVLSRKRSSNVAVCNQQIIMEIVQSRDAEQKKNQQLRGELEAKDKVISFLNKKLKCELKAKDQKILDLTRSEIKWQNEKASTDEQNRKLSSDLEALRESLKTSESKLMESQLRLAEKDREQSNRRQEMEKIKTALIVTRNEQNKLLDKFVALN